MAWEAYQSDKSKQFAFDRCYQILKHHKRFDLSTTSQNTQRSRFVTEHGGSLSINLSEDSSPVDIESPSDWQEGREAYKEKEKSCRCTCHRTRIS